MARYFIPFGQAADTVKQVQRGITTQAGHIVIAPVDPEKSKVTSISKHRSDENALFSARLISSEVLYCDGPVQWEITEFL